MSGNEDLSGKHTALTLRPQSGNPTTGVDQAALFTKIVSSIPHLFFAPNNSQTPIQLTYNSLTTTGLTQHTFMAGPFIVYGGFINNPTLNQVVNLSPGSQLIYVDLTIGFYSAATTILAASACPTNVAGTSFNITYPSLLVGSGVTFGVYYLAIGLP